MAKERVLEKKPVFFGIKVWMKEVSILSEKDALRLVKRGHRDAYGMIVKTYMKTAYYIVLGFVHNHQDALDLSQEAFIRAFRNIKSGDSCFYGRDNRFTGFRNKRAAVCPQKRKIQGG